MDLSKQNKQTERAKEIRKSPNVREREEREKCEQDKDLAVAPNNSLTMKTNDDVMLADQAIEDKRKVEDKNTVQDEPMEIVENDTRQADVSIHEVIVYQTALSSSDTADNENLSTTNLGHSQSQSQSQSSRNDPRFYVCTSFTASCTPQTHCGSNPGSSLAASSIAVSTSRSCEFSQLSQYHDYCLSEGEFDITSSNMSFQSTPSDIAKMAARSKEAKIFRQIEGDDFDEKNFFDNAQIPNISADDDVIMLAM